MFCRWFLIIFHSLLSPQRIIVYHVASHKHCQSPSKIAWKYMLFLGILQLSQGVYHKHAIPLSYSCISGGFF